MVGPAMRSLGPLKATFSIVAADPSAGQVGAAVQSKYLAVGAVVPWARAGVGAVATQARGIARYGPAILDALSAGEGPQTAINSVLVADPLAGHRQIGVVRADGEAANYTGPECIQWAGARAGPGFSVQGNILAGEGVLDSMANAFIASTGALAERLLASLEAGQAAGGDRRGQQSAALVVEQVRHHDVGAEGIDRLVDLRVDDHSEPIKELRRLFGLWQILEVIEKGLERYNKGDYSGAVQITTEADTRFPNTPRILYNLACFECMMGLSTESLAHLERAITIEASWREAARADRDFDNISSTSEFIRLTSA